MKFRIHYTIDGFEDYVDISGETIEDIRTKVSKFFADRGLSYDAVNAWSEEIK